MKFKCTMLSTIAGAFLLGCNSMPNSSNSGASSKRDPAGLYNIKAYFAKEVITNFGECIPGTAPAGNELATVAAERIRVILVGNDDRGYVPRLFTPISYLPGSGQARQTSEGVSFTFSGQNGYSALDSCKAFVADLKKAAGS